MTCESIHVSRPGASVSDAEGLLLNLTQKAGIGVERLKDNPDPDTKMVPECDD